MIFKPSPFTPVSVLLLAEIYTEAGVPPGLFNVVQGGAATGQFLCLHRDVAKTSIGSHTHTAVPGRRGVDVGGSSSDLTWLELGGGCRRDWGQRSEVCSEGVKQGGKYSGTMRTADQRGPRGDGSPHLPPASESAGSGPPLCLRCLNSSVAATSEGGVAAQFISDVLF